MSNFHDLGIKSSEESLRDSASNIGWESTSLDYDTSFLDAGEWGELKRSIDSENQEAEILVFEGGDQELNRKVAEDGRVDIIMHPERGRKDSGMNHVSFRMAAENDVAIGFDLSYLLENEDKYRSFVLKHWRRNLMLCEKFGVSYIITTGAEEKLELRAPRDLKSIIDSLGHDGSKAVSEYPEKIINQNKSGKTEPRD